MKGMALIPRYLGTGSSTVDDSSCSWPFITVVFSAAFARYSLPCLLSSISTPMYVDLHSIVIYVVFFLKSALQFSQLYIELLLKVKCEREATFQDFRHCSLSLSISTIHTLYIHTYCVWTRIECGGPLIYHFNCSDDLGTAGTLGGGQLKDSPNISSGICKNREYRNIHFLTYQFKKY